MLKRLISVLLIGFALAAYPTKSLAGDYDCSRKSTIMGPGIDHWPWGSEIAFPWRGIQGLWTSTNSCTNYFSFKIVKKAGSGEKILQIHEISPYTCEVVSQGVGTENNRILTAVMTSATRTIELKVHVFRESDVDRSSRASKEANNPSSSVTVMTVNTLGATAAKRVSMQLIKVRNSPDIQCYDGSN